CGHKYQACICILIYIFSLSSLDRVLFFFIPRCQPVTTLFPYTTLFRSRAAARHRGHGLRLPRAPRRLSGVRHAGGVRRRDAPRTDRKSTRLNSSHVEISYAVFCSKKQTSPMALGLHVAKYVNKQPEIGLGARGLRPRGWDNAVKPKLSLPPKKLVTLRVRRNAGRR